MTIKHSSLDVYFHMRNHYKKLRLAKAVIKNRPSSASKKLTPFSSPARNDVADKADEELPQPSKQSRPASETKKLDPADLQKLKKAHYPYHSIHLAKHDCSRPVTRRNLSDMPDGYESPTRLSQVEEREWDQPDVLLEQSDDFLEQSNASVKQPDILFEQSDKLEKDSDHDDESLKNQNASWSGLKRHKHQELGCVCGAIYAGGDETYGSRGTQDVGYLEIWECDKGQETKQGNGKHEGRKSISKVYTVLPLIMDLPNDSPDGTQKQEPDPNKLYYCNKMTCKARKQERGVATISDVAEDKEKPLTEKHSSESETESSKQDSSRDDDDVTQDKQSLEEFDKTQQPVDDSTKVERPSRSKDRIRLKAPYRDSLEVIRLKKMQEKSKDSTRSEAKADSTKQTCSIRSVIEHEYLQFSLRITEDIIRNDLYDNDEMKRVFNSHTEANRGRLDMNKMRERIRDLCKELNIAYDVNTDRSSCREDVGKVQENLKNIICFSSPQKHLCLPCAGQLTSEAKVDDNQRLEEKRPSVESELKTPSQTIDKDTSGEGELRGARNKTKTPPLQIIAEAAPPTGEKQKGSASPHRNKTATPAKAASLQTDEFTSPVKKQLRSASPSRNKTAAPAKVASLQIDECTSPVEKQLGSASPSRNKTATPARVASLQIDECTSPVEKQLGSASPSRNKTATPPQFASIQIDEFTSSVEKHSGSASPSRNKTATPAKIAPLQTDESAPPVDKQSRNANPDRKKAATPTKEGRPKTKQSFTIGESDKLEDAAMTSSEQPKREEINVVDSGIPVGRVPENICPVCCAGKPVCLPLYLKNLQPTWPETGLPAGDERRKIGNEEVKPNLIFVAPSISSEKKDFAAMVKQTQRNQTTQRTKIKTVYPKASGVVKSKADKSMQEDLLTGIPALDNTLRKYNLEMLSQNCDSPSRCECQTRAEPLLHETYSYKTIDFMHSQKATDDFVVVSGPIYIPAHVFDPNTYCNCAPFASFLKPLPSTCTDETRKSPCVKRDLKHQINLLLTEDYNSRNHPDVSMFYPTVSTQTSLTDFANRPKLASTQKSVSAEPVILKTPPVIVPIDKMEFDPLPPKKQSIKSPPQKKEKPLEEESRQHFDLADYLRKNQRLKKEMIMEDVNAADEEEEKTEEKVEKSEENIKMVDSGPTEISSEESSEMFLLETQSSTEEGEHLKQRVDQIIDMRGNQDESNGSIESINNERFKSSSTDALHGAPKIEGEKREKRSLDATMFMKKLDHKPNMSMTNSMANNIKKVNRESQQFRSPDDKRITWGSRRLKIRKLTESDNEIGVIQEEEERESVGGQSIKSENNKVE